MTTVYFVRHAHSTYSLDDYNRPLSSEGLLEAGKLGEIFNLRTIHHIYSSPYCRAIETVQPIAQLKNLPIIEEEHLKERVLSSTSVSDFQKAIESVWENPHLALEGGESNIEAQQRVIPFIQELIRKHENENIVIGTHGNILTLLLNYFDPKYGLEFWNSLKMPDIIVTSWKDNRLIEVRRLLDLKSE